ncbi:FCD domain-containing protein [Actinomadura vinacea]|uniref:FCD domain-containing protein n=1 Tax=Actinomadura vinacea TaxID=115336 RepID=A0ABN3KDQ7_9ACTN
MADNDRAGLHGSVLDQLGVLITSARLRPGEVLRIEQLESRFGVSRSVVREAIRVLESMGMVTSRRRVGITVAPRAGWNLFDPRIIAWRLDGAGRDEQLRSLSELRRGIEPVAAALAAVRATPAQCGALTGAVMEMSVHGRSGDLEAYLAADILFHRTLLEASGNEMLGALSNVVAAVLTGRTHHHLMPARPEPFAIRWHAEVAQAVQAGDAEAAERAMRDIVEEATQAMLDPSPPA